MKMLRLLSKPDGWPSCLLTVMQQPYAQLKTKRVGSWMQRNNTGPDIQFGLLTGIARH